MSELSPPTPEVEERPPASSGTPYTVFFPDGRPAPADLEHPAPLPRIGETVEYLDATGRYRRYVVSDVIHTLQPAADRRSAVRDEPSLPAGVPRERASAAGQSSGEGALRAGLPKIILAAVGDASEETAPGAPPPTAGDDR